jgi:pentatricopeptide repeat protein
MRRRDVVSWSTMISGFAHCGKPDEAIAVYQEMDRDLVKPNVITIINLLEACSVTAELKRSKWAHGVAIRQGFASEVTVGTAVVDMYSKCGEILASRRAFDQLALKNIVTWSAMIAAYGMNGLAHEALALFAEMKRHGLKPNPVTTLSVLAACSHGGLVEEGLSLFKSMVQELGLEPGFEHYSCMVDMLGRAGKLDTAIEVIKAMPDNLKNGASIWGSLLSACRSYGLTELGKEAISRVLELEPSNSAGYLVASSMYAADGLWDDAARIRVLAKEKGVKVVAGYSLVHIDNKACRFVAGDGSHPRSDEIFSMAQQLHDCIKIDEKKEGNTWLAVIECLT